MSGVYFLRFLKVIFLLSPFERLHHSLFYLSILFLTFFSSPKFQMHLWPSPHFFLGYLFLIRKELHSQYNFLYISFLFPKLFRKKPEWLVLNCNGIFWGISPPQFWPFRTYIVTLLQRYGPKVLSHLDRGSNPNMWPVLFPYTVTLYDVSGQREICPCCDEVVSDDWGYQPVTLKRRPLVRGS